VRFRLIVFDLDGTLVDSRRDLAESANAVLRESGCAPLPEHSIGRLVGDGAATLVARVFAAAGCPQPADALERFLAVYNGRLLTCTRPYPGIPDVLAELARRTRLAVLTNKPLAATMTILEGLGLGAYFPADDVIGGDGPFPRKPDPGGLQHLALRAGLATSETILVGDSVIDWRTARAAGAHICLAGYGFGFEGFPMADLGVDDRVVDSPAALLMSVSSPC
jgi:phosphoglycolate phosphatase